MTKRECWEILCIVFNTWLTHRAFFGYMITDDFWNFVWIPLPVKVEFSVELGASGSWLKKSSMYLGSTPSRKFATSGLRVRERETSGTHSIDAGFKFLKTELFHCFSVCDRHLYWRVANLSQIFILVQCSIYICLWKLPSFIVFCD